MKSFALEAVYEIGQRFVARLVTLWREWNSLWTAHRLGRHGAPFVFLVGRS